MRQPEKNLINIGTNYGTVLTKTYINIQLVIHNQIMTETRTYSRLNRMGVFRCLFHYVCSKYVCYFRTYGAAAAFIPNEITCAAFVGSLVKNLMYPTNKE